MPYREGGISPKELVTGITTSVKDQNGRSVKIGSDYYTVILTPISLWGVCR